MLHAATRLESSNGVGQNRFKKALPGLPKAIKEKFLAAAGVALPNGNFAYSDTYAIDAVPNPGLNVNGLGPIELPSSQMGARKIVKFLKHVSDTGNSAARTSFEWSSLLRHFSLDNPKWKNWVERELLSDVCAALDVQDVAKHRCQLEKLSLLMEGSSETLYHPKDRYGSIIVILPCPFSGGVIHASTRDRIEIFDLASGSARSISVVAILSGVECRVKPITSGYQLALYYSLQPLHDDGSFPQVPRLLEAASLLRSTLLAWRKQFEEGEMPTALLAYLFQGKIVQPSQAGTQFLSGFDSNFLRCLLSSARELDFEIYIASARLKISGMTGLLRTAQLCMDAKCTHPTAVPHYCPIKVTDLKPDKFATRKLLIEGLFDVKGMPVEISALDVRQEDIINPEYWQSGTPDIKQTIVMDAEHAKYEYHYERAMLLLWPNSAERPVRTGDVYDYTCNALRKSRSLVARPEENNLIELLLQCCRERQDESEKDTCRLDGKKTIGEKLTIAMRVLYDTAERWKDVDVFKSALQACPAKRRIALVGIDTFVAAMKAFGWTTIKDVLALALAEEGNVTRRRVLISQITKIGEKVNNREIKQWCKEQNESVIHSLNGVGLNQVDWLLSLVKERGAEYFRDILLPQLLAQKPITDFWLSFVWQLHEQKDSVPSSSPSLIDALISQCVHRAAETCVPFRFDLYKFNSPTGEVNTTVTSTEERLMDVIALCVRTNNVEICAVLFQSIDSLRQAGAYSTHSIMTCYEWGGLQLDLYLRAKPELDAFSHVFRVFFENAAVFLLRGKADKASPENLKVIMKRAGRPEQIFAKCAEAEALHPMLKRKDIFLLISSISSLAAEEQDDDGFKHACSVAFIDSIDLRSLHKRNNPSCPDNGAQILMNDWYMCLKNGMHLALQHLTGRLLSLLAGPDGETQFNNLLMPMLVCIRRALEKRKMTLTGVSYYVELCVGMARYYANTLSIQANLTRTASPGLFGCVCQECDALKKFLCSSEQTVTYELDKSSRKHMVSQLSKAKIALSNLRWTLRQQNQGPALEVCKPPSSNLSGFDSDGLEFLSRLGDTASQKRILGVDYNWIFAAIVGKVSAPAARQGGTASAVGQKRSVESDSQAMCAGFATVPKKPKFV